MQGGAAVVHLTTKRGQSDTKPFCLMFSGFRGRFAPNIDYYYCEGNCINVGGRKA